MTNKIVILNGEAIEVPHSLEPSDVAYITDPSASPNEYAVYEVKRLRERDIENYLGLHDDT